MKEAGDGGAGGWAEGLEGEALWRAFLAELRARMAARGEPGQ